MTTQLEVWNLALLHVGERNLTATNDAVPARYALDDAWAGAINHCLAQGYWNFAMRTATETSDGAGDPDYRYYFSKPDDIVRLYNIYQDSSLRTPLLDYDDRFGSAAPKYGRWYANQDPIYVQYVSNHATLGGGLLAAWPQLFTDYVALYLARLIVNRVAGSNAGAYDRLVQMEKRALLSALSKDGMDEPVKFPPRGSWADARLSGAAALGKQP